MPLKDLINVSDSSKQLKVVADLAFRLEHGTKVLRIVGLRLGSCFDKKRFIDPNTNLNVIFCTQLKATLQVLRSFGHLIRKLDILMCDFHNGSDESLRVSFNYLIFYLNEYCIESLTEIQVTGKPGATL